MKQKTRLELTIECLKEEQSCYNAILAKLKDQKAAIDEENESRLLEVVEEKNVLIAAIGKLEQKITKARKDFSGEEEKRFSQQTGPLRAQIENALKKIISIEDACEKELNERKLKMLEQILEIKQGKNMLKGYGKSGKDPSNFSKNA